MDKVEVKFYTKQGCHLCDQVLPTLKLLAQQYNFHLQINDIHRKDKWLEKYMLMIPVVEVFGDIIDYGQIDHAKLSKALERICTGFSHSFDDQTSIDLQDQ